MAKKNMTQLARKALLRKGRTLLRARTAAGVGGASYLDGMSDADRRQLEEIHAALERIERGIFGRCQDCDGKIEPARIEQVPYMRVCEACETTLARDRDARTSSPTDVADVNAVL